MRDDRLLVLTITAFGLAAYETAQALNLSSKNSDLSAKADSLTAKLNADEQSIATLNSQISGLQTQIATLQAQHSTDLATIGHLQAELAANYTQLQTLEKANVVIVARWTWTPAICVIFLGCISPNIGAVTDAAWANLGTITANNIMVTVTFLKSDMPVCSFGPVAVKDPVTGSNAADGESIHIATDIPTMVASCTVDGPAIAASSITATIKLTWS